MRKNYFTLPRALIIALFALERDRNHSEPGPIQILEGFKYSPMRVGRVALSEIESEIRIAEFANNGDGGGWVDQLQATYEKRDKRFVSWLVGGILSLVNFNDIVIGAQHVQKPKPG